MPDSSPDVPAPDLAVRAARVPGPPGPAPPPRRRVRKRWVTLVVAVLGAVAAGAALWYAARVQQGIEATFDAQEAYVAEAERAFQDIPLLTDAEIGLLRRSRNARHVELAQRLGAPPPDTRAEIDSLVSALDLRRIETNPNYVVLDGRYSAPYLTPSAAASLDSIAVRFRDRLATKGLPPFRFTVSSVWRSAEDQATLQGRNVNAAAGRSSHEYGTTYDITYNPTRYSPAPDALPPPPSVDPRVPGFLRETVREELVEEQRAALDRLARDFPSRLTAALGRALIELEDEGVLIVVRERRQPVYHVTVAQRLTRESPDVVEPVPARDPVPHVVPPSVATP